MREVVSLVPWPVKVAPPLPVPAPVHDPTPSWWSRYRENLAKSSLSSTAREVIDLDSTYILERGVLGNGPAGDVAWPPSRVRKGLIMGSVQSGKTASMLAVAAKSIDEGVDMVVILSGTQVGLWRQTYKRFVDQLDVDGAGADNARVLLPARAQGLSGEVAPPTSLYGLSPARARRAVQKGRPVVAVCLKNVHHLKALTHTITSDLVPEAARQSKAFHILVLDDEADDGSIDTHGLEGNDLEFRQLPNTIVDLWDDRPRTGSTRSESLHVTYLAYTATPQANFLQRSHNVLAPTDFVVSLRTPLDHGEILPRAATFSEPNGLASYYVGGDLFYRRAADPSPAVVLPEHQTDAVADAATAFLVAGAIRLWRRGPSTLLPREVLETSWASEREALRQLPPPHSMLFHPSAQIVDQFDAAAEILAWAADLDAPTAQAAIRNGTRSLPIEPLTKKIDADDAKWVDWMLSYARSTRQFNTLFTSANLAEPTAGDWPDIRRLLVEEVIPTTRLAIVNSDPSADDRPQFEPVQHEGTWVAPPNISTIFVAGNVMSRGLTLEGLTTTLFLRSSDDPYADTQTQMQRWFGYRGAFIDVVRLFADSRQIELFGAYHDADEALRAEVIALMDQDGPAPRPTVLQGNAFSATGKITDVRSVPLWPGPTPFIRMINAGQQVDLNTTVLGSVLAGSASHEVDGPEAPRGRILDTSLSLDQAADLLDQLRFDGYLPSPDGWQAARWRAAERHIRNSGANLSATLYRTPAPTGTPVRLEEERAVCPYSMSAYLRLWSVCLNVRSNFFTATDGQGEPWSMVDLDVKREQQPRFWVAVRYGSEAAEPIGGQNIMIRPMSRSVEQGQLVATWGSRNRQSDWAGDEWFDLYASGLTPSESELDSGVRQAGRDGLLLFHVVKQAGGTHLTTTVGLAIPEGGPDQIAARPRA